MTPSFSSSGEKLGGPSGILELMDDLGAAMAQGSDMRMMGGGNPALIPEMAAVWRQQLRLLLEDEPKLDSLLAHYQPPIGNPDTRQALANFLNETYDWGISVENIAVVNGGQSGFFYLFNMLAGECSPAGHRKILLPLMPEYIGYENQGVRKDFFQAFPPRIEWIDEHNFKYRIDFDRLSISEDIAAICVSRPTNPSGNVLDDNEIQELSARAKEHHIPLIIDHAYGAPFPNIVFKETSLSREDHWIFSFSLSKLGLPGTRTAFLIAAEPVIQAIRGHHAVIALANNNIGQAIVHPLIENGELARLSQKVILPFYRKRRDQALAWVHQAFGKTPYAVHVSEGALFLWLYFPALKVPVRELYERLKERKVLVVPGHYFFFGLDEPFSHAERCIRLTYSQEPKIVEEGIGILAEEVERLSR